MNGFIFDSDTARYVATNRQYVPARMRPMTACSYLEDRLYLTPEGRYFWVGYSGFRCVTIDELKTQIKVTPA